MDIEFKLRTETVDQTSPSEPLCVDTQTPIRQVFRQLQAQKSGSVLVCRDGALVGIFTERDALRLMARRADLDAPIESVMVASPVTVRADATIGSAILRMSSGGYRRLPIIDGQSKPLGVIQVAGIVHYLAEHFPRTIYNQPPVAHPVMHDREGS